MRRFGSVAVGAPDFGCFLQPPWRPIASKLFEISFSFGNKTDEISLYLIRWNKLVCNISQVAGPDVVHFFVLCFGLLNFI